MRHDHRSDAGDGHGVGRENHKASEDLPAQTLPNFMLSSPGYSPLLKELLIFIHDAGDDALQAAHGRVHAEHD